MSAHMPMQTFHAEPEFRVKRRAGQHMTVQFLSKSFDTLCFGGICHLIRIPSTHQVYCFPFPMSFRLQDLSARPDVTSSPREAAVGHRAAPSDGHSAPAFDPFEIRAHNL